ncbi:putative ABC-type sugar transport system,periplasmic component [Vibrio nigripulchritudo SFn27]|uniref:Putative ABC-type sugar transport system, periplasmic component n=1 Tax=Vibrio nigripulchritudo TaxID=28173 RepID=U4JVS4_9VIBR|nr:extracellular solute-binding protein [Vibrio nigripulchritudo]CCN84302.1 putative ABC-type sugar transport system,periplasmic component [Vibrio nigripulchritudo BLFn1]CCN89556.1 putative ABC-type sugar transport system,periplasmic component [Vibrio nigripulchritudo SFn27]CCN94024.1 putative ABC-type sugar transport system,periplasmic component [Vibrio nigripulchritudo ENn2]CCO43121.1 putative ABC-type sugar transport system,periplasmic component [Vibrio nigripulchritudo SFn135]CCO55364.1 pu
MNRFIFKATACAICALATLPSFAKDKVVVWVSGEPGQVTVYDKIAVTFNQKYKDAEIQIVTQPSDLFNPALIPALSSGEGPDLFTFGTGPGQPAAIINGGLVADLTPHYYENNWEKYIPEGVVSQTSKSGKLWAFGSEVETTAMFYNKAIFKEVGINPPKTWDELASAVKALKEAGFKTPIGLGAADKWPISHWQSMMFGRYASPQGIDNVLFSDGKWTDKAFVDASAKLQKMSKDGWFGPSPIAVNYGDLMDNFWAGRIPMTYTGPWVIPGGIKSTGKRIGEFGIFQMPPMESGQKIYPTESIGSGWYVRANSESKQHAVAFLNHMFTTQEGRVTLLNDGIVPVGPLEDALEKASLPALSHELRSSVDTYRTNGTVPAFLDTITPANLTTVTYDGLQALLLGVMTPEAFTEELQAAWEEAKAEGKILEPGGLDKP